MTNSQTPEAANEPSSTDQNQPPVTLPPLYSNPEPLHPERHGKLAIRKDFNFGFARGINAVPANAVEMPDLCHVCPIGFAPGGNAAPIALIGLRHNENLFVDEQGRWMKDTYIPAYIRRYPFVFAEVPGKDDLTLCVDVADHAVEEREEGRFFNDDGTPSDFAKFGFDFCKTFQAHLQYTDAFCKALLECDVLVDQTITINLGEGQQAKFSGFRAIDEKKFAALPDEKFVEFRNQGWLPLVYAHFFSAAQVQRLASLLRERLEKEYADQAANPAAPDASPDASASSDTPAAS